MLRITHWVSARTPGLVQIKLASKQGLFRAFLMKAPPASLSVIFALEETVSLCMLPNRSMSVLHQAGPSLLWVLITTRPPFNIPFLENFQNQKGKQPINNLPIRPPNLPPPYHRLPWAKLPLSCCVLRQSEPHPHSTGRAFTWSQVVRDSAWLSLLR